MQTSLLNRAPNRIDAAHELLRRRFARKSLIAFTQYVSPFYRVDPFHQYIGDALDRVVNGEMKRLMIFSPPQHGKTEAASIHLPAYWLGNHPNDSIILASYGASRAYANSRKTRALVESRGYRALFGDLGAHDVPPVDTNPESRAQDHWMLKSPYRAEIKAGGVVGSLTGEGATLAIIDDPLRDWKDAQSAIMRDSIWEWYQNTFISRLREGAAIVLIMTRWHQHDLAGRILESEGHEWTVLRFPALAETQWERNEAHKFLGLPQQIGDLLGRDPGEPLAPQRFSQETLESRRRTSGFFAVYQQIPRPPDGDRFKRLWFEGDHIVAFAPEHCRRIRYWDKAGSTSESAKYTAGVLMAFDDVTGKCYIEDVVRGKWAATEREEIMHQTAIADKANHGQVIIWIEQEPGSGGLESADNTVKRLVGFAVKKDRPTGDKDLRLEPFESYAGAGNVFMVRGAWNTPYVDELIAIPNGTYRDQSDATSGAFNKLTLTNRGFRPRIVQG